MNHISRFVFLTILALSFQLQGCGRKSIPLYLDPNVLNLDARSVSSSGQFLGSGCSGSQLNWYERSGNGMIGVLSDFSGCGASLGWNGSGTKADPYRLNFDGTTGPRVVLDSSDTLNPAFITISLWVKFTASTGGIVCKGVGSSEVWCLDFDSSKYRFFIRRGGVQSALDLGSGPTGQVENITVTFDGSVLSGFINGANVSSSNVASGNLSSNTSPVTLGSRQSGGGAFDLPVTGEFYQVQIWSSSLSQTEVQSICNSRKADFTGVVCN